MQNISHVPIRIDWVVYDIDQEVNEQPRLIELIPVVDNNPFDDFGSRVTLNEANDEFMSQTTASTSKKHIDPQCFDSFRLRHYFRNKFSIGFRPFASIVGHVQRAENIPDDQTVRQTLSRQTTVTRPCCLHDHIYPKGTVERRCCHSTGNPLIDGSSLFI